MKELNQELGGKFPKAKQDIDVEDQLRYCGNFPVLLLRVHVWISSGTCTKQIQGQISGISVITSALWLSSSTAVGTSPSSLDFRLWLTLLLHHQSSSSTDNSTCSLYTAIREVEASRKASLVTTDLGWPAVSPADSQGSFWLIWHESSSYPGNKGWSMGCSTAEGKWTSLKGASSEFPFSYSMTQTQRHVRHWQDGQWTPQETPFLQGLVSNSELLIHDEGCCLTLSKRTRIAFVQAELTWKPLLSMYPGSLDHSWGIDHR